MNLTSCTAYFTIFSISLSRHILLREEKQMKNWLEKQFRLSEFHTDVKTEILAGLTTFVTMAYILATVPNIMSGAGFDKHVTLTIMILLIIVTTCAMALYTNRPFALAPGLGSVGIIASMITNEGVSAPIAAGVIFWSGVLFIIISFLGLREAVVRVIPVSLKQSVSAGIGLFIALLGAKNCGLIVANDAKNCLSFGDFASPSVIVAAIGFLILMVIKARNVPGGMILAIVLTTIVGIPFGVTHAPEQIFSLPAGIGKQFMNIDFLGVLNFAYIPFLIALFVPDFFSTFGTVLGVGAKAGYLDKDGNLPGIDKCFKVDAISTSLGDREIIAEDLGYLTDSVKRLVEESGYPNMKVIEFAFDERDTGNASDYLPHNYPRNCVVYTGTHDNETLLSWLEDITPAERRQVRKYLNNFKDSGKELCDDLICLVMQSVANLCIVPMQDYLGLDNSARMNQPSTLGKNWKWRLKEGQFTAELQKEMLELATRYGRK